MSSGSLDGLTNYIMYRLLPCACYAISGSMSRRLHKRAKSNDQSAEESVQPIYDITVDKLMGSEAMAFKVHEIDGSGYYSNQAHPHTIHTPVVCYKY